MILWFPWSFFGFFGFPRKGVCFLWFPEVASSRNQKNSRKMLALEVSKLQKPKKLVFFLFFSIQNQKTKHSFEETKRNQKNSRETKESFFIFFSLKPRILFQKIVFWVFGSLVVACLKSPNSKNQKHSRKMLVWEVSKLQKPTRLIEKKFSLIPLRCLKKILTRIAR